MNYFGLYDKLMFFLKRSIAQFVNSGVNDLKYLNWVFILFIVCFNKYYGFMYKRKYIVYDLILSVGFKLCVFCTQN